MKPIRFLAAAFAAGITYATLSAVVSIAEPQRSTLMARQSAPAASQAVRMATQEVTIDPR